MTIEYDDDDLPGRSMPDNAEVVVRRSAIYESLSQTREQELASKRRCWHRIKGEQNAKKRAQYAADMASGNERIERKRQRMRAWYHANKKVQK